LKIPSKINDKQPCPLKNKFRNRFLYSIPHQRHTIQKLVYNKWILKLLKSKKLCNSKEITQLNNGAIHGIQTHDLSITNLK